MYLRNIAKVILPHSLVELQAFASGFQANVLTIFPISGLMERVLQKATLIDSQKNEAGSNDFDPAFLLSS